MNQEATKKLEEWKEEVKKFKEVDLFLAIEGFGYILWREAHDYADGRFDVSEAVFKENQEYYNAMLRECLPLLRNFDVDPDSSNDRENGSYWKWYTFWKDWMNSFTREGWDNFQFLQSEKKPFDHLLPKTKWNDLPQETPVKDDIHLAIEADIEEHQKKLKEFLQLPDDYDHLSDLKNNGWSDEEISMIVDHFLEGGMLSEIIAPARNAGSPEAILASEEALRRYDQYFYRELEKAPALKDRFIERWARKKSGK